MTGIVVHLRRWEQRRLQRLTRSTRDAGIRSRTLIVLHAAAGQSTVQIADAVGYDPSAVLKVLHRFERTSNISAPPPALPHRVPPSPAVSPPISAR